MATRSEMIDACKARGHKAPFLLRLPVSKLTALYESGAVYTGKTEPPTEPATTAVNTPISSAPALAPTGQPAPSGGALSALLTALQSEITPGIVSSVRESLSAEIRALIDAADDRPRETVLTINTPEKSTVTRARHLHKAYPELLSTVQVMPVYLHGGPGWGKSTAAQLLAEDISAIIGEPVDVFMQSFSPASQQHELIGIPGINGHPAQKSPMWQAWERPSVFLADELDATPELFVQANAGVANGYMTFADGKRYQKHPHCYIIAAGNTIMSGATMEYTSRARVDKATIDRFAFLAWDEDPAFELAVAGNDQADWVKHVQTIRKAINGLGASAPDCIVTPRASINGAKMLRTIPGMTWDRLEHMLIWRGLPEDEISKVRQAMRQGR